MIRVKGSRIQQKKSALVTIADFNPLFDAQRFHDVSSNYTNHCSETKRGLLGIIGHGLEPEFGEPPLEKPDANELISALYEIKELLTDSSISVDLQVNLARQIDAMIWWLEHPEMASLQNLFENAASAVVIAGQMRDRDAERNSAQPTASKTVYERMMAFANTVGRMVRFGTRGIEAVDKLTTDVHHLIENLSPPT